MTNRDEYVEKLKARLDERNAELTRWEAKTKVVQTDARIEYERRNLTALTRKLPLRP